MDRAPLMKSLFTSLVVGASVVASPAQAFFWGPSHQKVCEMNLEYIQKQRDIIAAEYGSTPVWSGSVISTELHDSPVSAGFKKVTGCSTQFTMDGDRWNQPSNIEYDKVNKDYYVTTGRAIRLRD